MLAGSARGQPLAVPLRRPILQSWARCAGMSPDAADEPRGLHRGELQDRLARHLGLVRAATPDIDTLAQMVRGAHSLVLLADAQGVILQATGNTDFLHQAERVALRPGVSWAETERGTNAIGTVLVEASPLQVHGQEHFLARNRILSCHAAPIQSPRGELLGVLDISGDARASHAYALGLATLAARHIANRLFETTDARYAHLVFHRQPALLDSAERGLLRIEDGRIVGANLAALALLQTDWATLLDTPVDAWLDQWRDLCATPRAVHQTDGTGFQGCLIGMDGGRQRSRVRRPEASATLPAHGRASIDTRDALRPRVRPVRLPAGVQHQLVLAQRALDGGLGVLVHGETGVGKEVFAQRLHATSRWRDGPFIAVNCAALPESLIEAELFGYEPGAYTGARRQGSRGLLREAHGGVLFLDEIGDMPLGLQTRLLRVLQERAVQPLGGGRAVPVEFGLVSATHRDLNALLGAGGFREDLFYRLQDLDVVLPPLRARGDLADFVQQELAALGTELGQPLVLAEDALSVLAQHPWPGNYRQLHSVLRTLVVMRPEGGEVTADDLPRTLRSQATQTPAAASAAVGAGHAVAPVAARTQAACGGVDKDPGTPHSSSSLRATTDQRIAEALSRHGGSMAGAARELGVHRSTLYRWSARRVAS